MNLIDLTQVATTSLPRLGAENTELFKYYDEKFTFIRRITLLECMCLISSHAWKESEYYENDTPGDTNTLKTDLVFFRVC